MAASMDAKYIQDHMVQVHTPESWGRSLAYYVLAEAEKGLAGKSAEAATVKATFHVSAIEAKGCIKVCYDSPWGPICIHVG